MKADTRKGKVQVVRGDDTLTHLQWVDRSTGEVVDDTIVFPEEAKFQPMPNPRCYMLKFAEEMDRNMYFWMQEAKTENDASLVAQVNRAIEAVPDDAEMSNAESAQVQPTPLRPQALFQTPVAAPPAANSPMPTSSNATPAAPFANLGMDSSAGSVQAGDLQAILRGLGQIPAQPNVDASALAGALGSALAAASQGGGAQMVAPGPGLAELLPSAELLQLLSLPGLAERLAEFLPEEHRSEAEVLQLAHSPQFLQQIETFSRALQTGQIDLSQFGLPADTGFSAADFLQAIQDKAEANQKEQQ